MNIYVVLETLLAGGDEIPTEVIAIYNDLTDAQEHQTELFEECKFYLEQEKMPYEILNSVVDDDYSLLSLKSSEGVYSVEVEEHIINKATDARISFKGHQIYKSRYAILVILPDENYYYKKFFPKEQKIILDFDYENARKFNSKEWLEKNHLPKLRKAVEAKGLNGVPGDQVDFKIIKLTYVGYMKAVDDYEV